MYWIDSITQWQAKNATHSNSGAELTVMDRLDQRERERFSISALLGWQLNERRLLAVYRHKNVLNYSGA